MQLTEAWPFANLCGPSCIWLYKLANAYCAARQYPKIGHVSLSRGLTLGLKPLTSTASLDLLHSSLMTPNLNVVLVHLCTSLGTMLPILQKYAWAQNPPRCVVCALVPSALLAAGVRSLLMDCIVQLSWRRLSGLHSCQKHPNRSLSCKVASWKTMKEMP